MKTSVLLALFLGAASIRAADYPTPVESDWVVRDFRFHTGETLPELRLHYITVGARSGEPVLILHGTNGNGRGFLRPDFAGELFGPGQPLDAATHFLILPDAIGAGKSSKPSDGLRTGFPQYNYDDMAQAQYRLVKEHLGVGHLRLVLGTSMGGMLAWVWGEKYPDFMDALLPTAAQPTAMAGRNWMLRRMVVDLIRNDPEWNGGNYTQQPHSLKLAQVYFSVATSGGTQAIYHAAPTREKADQILNQRLAQPSNADANDVIYQMEASRDYDPAPNLESIRARVMAINSADDERNPAELGVMEREIKRVKQGRYVLIPTGPETRGHGTMGLAKLWKQYLAEFLQPPVQASK
jgi:homoserine O-acetyltransferase/O-succinyltransferase